MAKFSKKTGKKTVLGRKTPKTHGWDDFFDPTTGKALTSDGTFAYKNSDGDPRQMKRRPGEGALIKEKYMTSSGKIKKGVGTASRFIVDQIAQDPQAVFTLTGGFYPTFGKQAAPEYAQTTMGLVAVEESFSDVGPSPMQVRGNHVWYDYAADYATTVQKMFERGLSPTGVDPAEGFAHEMNPLTEYSILPEIFEAYIDWVDNSDTTNDMMTSWRDAFRDGMSEEAAKESMGNKESFAIDGDGKDISESMMSSSAGGEMSYTEAPEEMIPKFLKTRYPEIFGTLEEIDTKADAKSKDNSMDIAFWFMDQLYIKEVTQERLSGSTSHTSILNTFKFNKKNWEEISEEKWTGDSSQMRTALFKHFDANRKAINTVLSYVGKKFNEQSTYTDIRKFADKELGMKWRANNKETKEFYNSLDAGSRTSIETAFPDLWKTTKSGINKGQTKFVSAALSGAMTSVMHLLGQKFGSGFGPKGKEKKMDRFTDLFVLSDKDPINVGFEYKVTGSLKKGTMQLQGTIADVVINPDASFYMNAFLDEMVARSDGKLQNFNEEQKRIIIKMTNMLWLAHAGKIEGAELTTGLVQQLGIGMSSSGALVAGGAIVYEDETVNKAIGSFLRSIMEKDITDKELREHPKVKQAMTKARQKQSGFTQLVRGIKDSVSTVKLAQVAEDNPDMARFMADILDLNQDLRTHSWAAPYLGIYYQGGFRASVWPLIQPTAKKS